MFVGFDGKIYCSVCYPKITPLPPDVNTSKIPAKEGSGCPKCGGKVFDAEKMTIKSGSFHKHCFSCNTCGQSLNYSNFTSQGKYCKVSKNRSFILILIHSVIKRLAWLCNIWQIEGRDVYCHGCFRKQFDSRARSVGAPDTTTIKGSASENCARCGGMVFDLEKVQAKKQVLHRNCLSCYKCKKPLLPSNFFDAPDGELYCKLCYASIFGHKRAKSVGPSNTRTIKPGPGDASCLKCGFTVFEAEKVAVRNGCYHISCFKCSKCNSLLDSSSANSDGGGGRVLCNGCFVKTRRQEQSLNE